MQMMRVSFTQQRNETTMQTYSIIKTMTYSLTATKSETSQTDSMVQSNRCKQTRSSGRVVKAHIETWSMVRVHLLINIHSMETNLHTELKIRWELCTTLMQWIQEESKLILHTTRLQEQPLIMDCRTVKALQVQIKFRK